MPRGYKYRGWFRQTCWVCGNEFTSRRSTATFCSQGCRKKVQRWRDAGRPSPSPLEHLTHDRPQRVADPYDRSTGSAAARLLAPVEEVEEVEAAAEETPKEESGRKKRRGRSAEEPAITLEGGPMREETGYTPTSAGGLGGIS